MIHLSWFKTDSNNYIIESRADQGCASRRFGVGFGRICRSGVWCDFHLLSRQISKIIHPLMMEIF